MLNGIEPVKLPSPISKTCKDLRFPIDPGNLLPKLVEASNSLFKGLFLEENTGR